MSKEQFSNSVQQLSPDEMKSLEESKSKEQPNEQNFFYKNEENDEQIKEPKSDYDFLQNVPKNPQKYYEPGASQQSELPKLSAQDPHITLSSLQNLPVIDVKLDNKKQEEEKQIEENNPEEENKDKEKLDIGPPPIKKPQLLTEEYFAEIDMREFLTKPCPKGYLIQTTIIRQNSGFNRFYPKYEMVLSNGKKYLMSAQKKPWNLTSNYVISISKDDFQTQSDQTLGKVRSDFLGTEFKIYGKGLNPYASTDQNKVREEIGVVLYEYNRVQEDKPRVMEIYLPEVKENGERFIFKPLNEEQGIIKNYKDNKKEGIVRYINKPPKWNDQIGAFVLNFNGRATQPSVKNCQLINEKDSKNEDEIICMLFGKIENNSFNLDIQYPFSLVQAFGIALSSFDFKIGCN